MECRLGCAACCIAPSINTAIPNMPQGKPAGTPCINLNPTTLACKIWESGNYPKLCREFKAELSICGESREFALETIRILEQSTKPSTE